MAPQCLGASEEAGCVSDFMANPFHNINFYFALSGFSVQACAQVRVEGRSWGGAGDGCKRCPRPRQQSSGVGKRIF